MEPRKSRGIKDISKVEIIEFEKELIRRARDYWDQNHPATEASDVEKLREFSLDGLVQGKLEHDIKKSFYKRYGYWDDGKTTLNDHKLELIKKKKEFGKRLGSIRAGQVRRIDDLVENLKKQRERLTK